MVFDRGGYVYHGRVKALLDASREAGLNKNENATDTIEASVTENSDTVGSTIGNIVGTVAGAISNLIGGSTDAPAKKSKKSATDRPKKTVDEPEAQSDKVDKESNENE